MTWIKICGNTNLEDARAAIASGADALGFVFAPSPRRMEPGQARDIVAQLPRQIEKIGVVANEPVEGIIRLVEQVGLTALQLHGEESPEFVRELYARLSTNGGVKIIRTLKLPRQGESLGDGVLLNLESLGITPEGRSGPIDAILLDSASALGRGGTGRRFDWLESRMAVSMINSLIKVIVAGGLSPENVTEAMQTLRPWGVDVCTGVECAPGRKDPDKLRAFVAAVRAADRL